jgi:hypothetical protein
MASTVTTVTVHPERAERLRAIRDERGLSSMDEALGEVLNDQTE